jgi:predicted HTH transcriptional regulator
MLNWNELKRCREDNRTEAKKAAGGLPRSIWETYSAFANTFGGYILLGVEELPDKSFHMVPLSAPEKLVADFWNGINNRQIVSVNILADKNNRLVQDMKTPFKLEGDTRVDDTPVHKAIREALVNSLIHANYYDRRGLVIHRRPQNITIANPGCLRVSVSDAVMGGFSDPRNITLIKLFNLTQHRRARGQRHPEYLRRLEEPRLETSCVGRAV